MNCLIDDQLVGRDDVSSTEANTEYADRAAANAIQDARCSLSLPENDLAESDAEMLVFWCDRESFRTPFQ